MAGIDEAERKQEWGITKEELYRRADVKRSSGKKYFQEEQGLKNRWRDYQDQSDYPR
jgi:hypothetical protein